MLTLFKKRPIRTLATIGVWSMMMIAVGIFAGNIMMEQSIPAIGFTKINAAPQSTASQQIIRLDRERLGGKNLGKFEPYEPEFGNLIARGYDYFYSKDENFGIGVWESKPGKITYKNLEYDELMYVLEGSMILTDEQGKAETFGPGEGLVLPTGWSGTLAVPEGGVRKIWVSYMAGVKGG